MDPLLQGVKVIELGEFVFIPSAAAVLADWGADVIKVEHPERGDTLRGHLSIFAAHGYDTGDFNYLVEQANRGKRSIGLDLAHPEGREIFLRLVAEADVLLTSLLEPSRERLGITYDDLKEINPRLIYARGHGQGQSGPAAYQGGIDTVAFWARSGMGYMFSDPADPKLPQRQGFGDLTCGMFLAGGIAAALFRRSLSGEGSLVDVSLLGSAMWMLAPDIVASDFMGRLPAPPSFGHVPPNPLSALYRTGDGRSLVLGMLKSDQYWPGFCHALGRPDLADHPDYDAFDKRTGNAELFRIITETLLSAPLAHWRERFDAANCLWSAVQTPLEVGDDPQSVANGYLVEHPGRPGAHLTASPVQFNNSRLRLRGGAPEVGQHTEEILLELGMDWPEIVALKDNAVVT
ncbi:CoA transferase [Frankia sp. CNm7]|uniref:CoA transferase n=1 Tax=Frankia nepalensis TaxID=1836974 RepID=A0A937UUC5_9ACTN|nr:CoA transferase [Frankia nepalensis]MBL7499147.1 CoA transferase [Frankia nepalensis]MBL7511035.1 CoA transferase [Frankia nepalensis]MBL7520497.1 CoA transferase [Frankia nepalensis]MBL7632115.1 CoA transferase [Frankia nepalensis]